jgi:hypothetical protein
VWDDHNPAEQATLLKRVCPKLACAVDLEARKADWVKGNAGTMGRFHTAVAAGACRPVPLDSKVLCRHSQSRGYHMKKTLLAVFGLIVMACEQPPETPPAPVAPSTYPQGTTVSPEDLASILPKDGEGKPILLEVAGDLLTIGAPRRDAIGAAAKCLDLLTACLRKTKDPDKCAHDVPRCKTATPWDEDAACCADACVVAYEEERRLGATVSEADAAVFGSDHECFPGRQEMYRAAGGTPYLAPRRASR